MLPLALISVMIYLMGNGSLVNINVTLTQSVALLNITLPVEPMPPITVQSSNGSLIPAILLGNQLIIPVFGNGTFIIRYVPSVTQSPGGYLVINVTSQYPINLFISNNVLITQLPVNLIVNFTKVSNGIILQLAPGNYSVGFVPELATVSTTTNTTKATSTTGTVTITTTNKTAPTSITNTSTASPPPSHPQHYPYSPYLYYVAIPIVVVVAASLLIYIFVIGRKRPEVSPVVVEGLNPTDKEVLKALVDAGGEALQADLQRKLGIPKTTLWRSIKRLEEAGYVQVIKEGRVNRVRLVKKPRFD